MITSIFISALLIITGFRVIHFMNRTLLFSVKIKHHLNYVLPVLELLVWIGLALWIVRHIYNTKNYFGLITIATLFLVLVIPGIYILRDFLAGIYLKLQNKISEGNIIAFDNHSGKIVKTNQLSLELIDKHGNIKSIPYYKIWSKIISKPGINPHLEKLNLIYKFSDNNSTNKILPELKKQILYTPWVSVSQGIFIEDIKHLDNQYIIEVIVYALKKEFAENIKSLTDKNLSAIYD